MSCFRVLCFACFLQTCFSYWACKDPELCNCLAGCEALKSSSGPGMECENRLLVVPNLGIYWGPRDIVQQVTAAKEKLAFEASKTYDAPWKDHVLNTKKGGVAGMYGLLGMAHSVLKSSYTAFIQGQMLAGNPKEKCDIAKCIAFCQNSCESMCEDLASTDEAALAGISWTKGMCDVEGAKAAMKTECSAVKDLPGVDCDANCDGAPGTGAFSAFVFFLSIGLVQK